MGWGWGELLWARERHGCVLLALVQMSLLGSVKDGEQVLVVDFALSLEMLAGGGPELEVVVEVSSHGAQSGLWCGEEQWSVWELGQMLASGEVERVNAGLE